MSLLLPLDREKWLIHLLQHVVLLTWIEIAGDKSKARCRAASGFVISVKDQWAWITAGHIIRRLENPSKYGIAVQSMRLFDKWTQGGCTDADSGYPVEFEIGRWFSVFDDKDSSDIRSSLNGKDYGGVLLSKLEQANLQTSGIVALDEQHWDNIPRIKSDSIECMIVGIPDETTNAPVGDRVGNAIRVTGHIRPVLAPIQISALHASESTNSEFPRFVGKLRDDLVPLDSDDGRPLKCMSGMSGGPVFMATNCNECGYPYYVIGIQSGFVANERKVTCCPLSPMAEVISDFLAPP